MQTFCLWYVVSWVLSNFISSNDLTFRWLIKVQIYKHLRKNNTKCLNKAVPPRASRTASVLLVTECMEEQHYSTMYSFIWCLGNDSDWELCHRSVYMLLPSSPMHLLALQLYVAFSITCICRQFCCVRVSANLWHLTVWDVLRLCVLLLNEVLNTGLFGFITFMV